MNRKWETADLQAGEFCVQPHKSFRLHSYEKRARKSFGIHSYKFIGLKVL